MMAGIVDERHLAAAAKARQVLSTYEEAEDLINIGAYVRGSNPKIDFAIQHIEKLNRHLSQGMYEEVSFRQGVASLQNVFEQ